MAELSSFSSAGRAPPPGTGKVPSWANLKAIADGQRMAMLALLAGVLVLPLSYVLGQGAGDSSATVMATTFLAGVIGVRAWMAVAVYRLTTALAASVPILWAIGAFLPNIIGLIVLAVASSRATTRLKAAGLKVGLLGAKLPEQPPPGFLCEELTQAF